jgi:hypothetical protein
VDQQLISMASTCCQSITHSPTDTRFDLSAMNLPPSMTGLRFQAPPSVGQLLPSTRTADLSEDGETLDPAAEDDHDYDLPSVKQMLASSKRAKRVIDLTCDDDDDGDSKGGDDDHTEVC